jgi:hypothetical protein
MLIVPCFGSDTDVRDILFSAFMDLASFSTG